VEEKIRDRMECHTKELAIIGTQLKYICDKLDGIDGRLERMDARVTESEDFILRLRTWLTPVGLVFTATVGAVAKIAIDSWIGK
jgi:hypothetical protein